MKKIYERPKFLIETYTPQEFLCSCAVVNKNFSESEQCGYPLEGTPLTVFAQTWTDCMVSEGDLPVIGYCYMPGANNVFSS